MIPVMLVMLVILTLLVILMMLVMESRLVMVVAKRECREAARLGTVGPEPPCWSLSHPPKLIIIAVCDINIRLLIPFWFLLMFSKSCFIQALFNLTK